MSNVKQVRKAHSSVAKGSRPRGRIPVDVQELMVKIMYDAPKGMTDAELSKFLDISEATYYNLKAANVDFLEVIKHYKKISPLEVLQAFKKCAIGFHYDETTKELEKDKKTGKLKLVVTKVVRKHVVPNASACWNYLKSQMPDEFKEKIETEHKFPNQLDKITFVINGKAQ